MTELKEEIKEIKELLKEKEEKKEKKKEFKIPFFSRVRPSKAKKNYVTLMKINENNFVEFKKVKIENQTFVEDGIPRIASAGNTLFYKKNPLIILPSWSISPFSPLENYEKSLKEGSNKKGYKLLLEKMMESSTQKKQVSGAIKWIVGIGLAIIIGYALLTGGG